MNEIHITAFGRFQGVENNPSQRIIEELSSGSETRDLAKTFGVVETSAIAAQEYISNLFLENQSFVNSESKKVILLHLGVHSGAKTFRLESCGYNNADFRCEDERGFKPTNQLIDTKCSLDEPLLTNGELLEKLNQELNKEEQICVISNDPGRFVCNYIFYQSLLCCKKFGKNKVESYFLHIPSFETFEKEKQKSVILKIIDYLSNY